MQNKEELKKQVIILGIILIISIVLAVILNMNKNNNFNNRPQNKIINNSTVETKNEMINNLKGLIEQSSEREIKSEEQTIKNTTITGTQQKIETNSNEVIQYEETWHGDN
ncbi:MAG: hypothetical protein Q4G09_00395 [Clostridia bacterium]|nr:hypothetical protein [Clostridia bacterium]